MLIVPAGSIWPKPVAGGGGGGDPSTIFGSDLIAWYKADTGVYKDAGSTLAANTDTVQQWNDQSGNGYHVTMSTAGRRPQYLSAGFNSSYPTVKFTSASDTGLATSTDAVGALGGTFAWFIVCQMATACAANGRLANFNNSGDSVDYSQTNSFPAITREGSNNNFCANIPGTGNVCITAISLDTNYRLGMVSDGTDLVSYVNNATGTTASGASKSLAVAGTLGIGTFLNNGAAVTGASWGGPVSEYVLVTIAPNSTQRNQLDAYFTSKWGL